MERDRGQKCVVKLSAGSASGSKLWFELARTLRNFDDGSHPPEADVAEAGEGGATAASPRRWNSNDNVRRLRWQLVKEGLETTLKRKYDPPPRNRVFFDRASEQI